MKKQPSHQLLAGMILALLIIVTGIWYWNGNNTNAVIKRPVDNITKQPKETFVKKYNASYKVLLPVTTALI